MVRGQIFRWLTRPLPLRKIDAAPLAEASRSFLGNVFGALGALVVLASFLLPFALVGAPLVWWLARRKKPAAPGAAG